MKWALGSMVLVACGGAGSTPRDAAIPPSDAVISAPDVSSMNGPAAPTLTTASLEPADANLNEETCLRVRHDGSPATRVRWIIEPETTPFDGADTRCITWPRVGAFRAFVTLSDGPRRVENSRVFTVVRRPSTPAPAASSTLAYDPSTSELWAVNRDADTVSVFRTDPPERLAEIPVCDRPRTLAVRDGVLAVACQGDGHVDLLRTSTRERIARVSLGAGSRPFGVAADPRGPRFAVTLQDAGRLVMIDPRGAILSSLELGADLRHLAINADGAALVARWRGEAQGGTVHRVNVTDPAALQRVESLTLARQEGLDSDTDNSGVPGYLGALAFAPHGRQAIVPGLKANIVTGRHRTGSDLTFQTTARAIFCELDLDDPSGMSQESWRNVFDDLDLASAVAYSPRGERVYVAVEGSEVVIALDTAGFNVSGSIRDVGGAPEGLWVSPDGARLWVHGFTTRTLRVFDVRDLSSPPPRVASLDTVEREALTPQQLLGLQVFYAARDPRMSRTSYLSCASCHLDGEGDNLTWDFTQRNEGLRNTIPLDGRAGIAHGPLHWSANFDELQDFEHDIRGGQLGTGFLSNEVFHMGTRDTTLGDPKAGLSPELDALAAWISTLDRFGVSPHRREGDAGWEMSFARGRQLFVASGCAQCHGGARFTDSEFVSPGVPRLHDVGTLRGSSGQRLGAALTGVDTPTLRGLWRSAPYLHDGSAATLREVLTTRNASDRHGRTSGLNDAQRADLETYLLSLDDRVSAAP